MSCLLLPSTPAPLSNAWLGPEAFRALCLFKMAFFFAFPLLLSNAMSGAAPKPLNQISGGFHQVSTSSRGS